VAKTSWPISIHSHSVRKRTTARAVRLVFNGASWVEKGIQLLWQLPSLAKGNWQTNLARQEKGGETFSLIFPRKKVVSVGYTCACTWFTSCNRNRIYICIFFFSGLADLIPLEKPNTGSEFPSTAEDRRETTAEAARKTTETKLQWRKFTRPEHLTMNRYNNHLRICQIQVLLSIACEGHFN